MQVELTVQLAGRSSRYVLRPAQRFVLGRAFEVSIHVDDEKISRRHLSIELTPDGRVLVTDLGSRNGTFVRGRRLEPQRPTEVDPGVPIQAGDVLVDVRLDGDDDKAKRERARTRRLDEPIVPPEEFELLAELGRGATGRVYAARQRLLDRKVAIKVLKEELYEEEEERERFLREGKVCCRVHSPYVVQVFDVRLGAGGRTYLIMELVDGPSAKDRLVGGPFAVPEAVKIAEEVALGLQAAHQVGVIHRDVKPANILLGPDNAKLSDFGIAKDLDALVSLTLQGEGLGTLAYVSPEQATDAKLVDRRTDIYSLGATLFHLLAGMPPFMPRDVKELIADLERPAPSLLAYRPDCPHEVAALVHRMLEKNPAERPPTAEVVARELRALRERLWPRWGKTESSSSGEFDPFPGSPVTPR